MFRALWPYLGRHRYRVGLAIALLVAAKLATVAVPWVLKEIVDALSRPETLVAVPVALLLAYALLRFAGTLFGEVRDLVFSPVGLQAMADLHARAFAHVLSLGARFHMQRETGRLTRDVERGVAGIGFLLNVAIFTIVPTFIEIAAVVLILNLNYDIRFTGIVLLTFLAYTGFTVAWTQRRALHQRAQNELDSRASARLVDTLLNYEAVKAYGKEALETARYKRLLGEWIGIGVRNQHALSALHIGQSALIAAGVASVMLLAGFGVANQTMTVGDLVLVNAYVIQICLPLNALGFVFRQARDALVNAEQLMAILDQQPDIQDPPNAPELRVKQAEVQFDRVDFSYQRGRRVLAGISFRIAPGSTVAVVGGSGSGKSTLARLLLRLYDVEAGTVCVDRQDVRDVTQHSLRRAIGLVPQDTALFNDTIAYNIGYGGDNPGLPEVIEAAKAAHIHNYIMSLPEKYDTVVGERGVKLSGGEKQRIAIARVILRNPRILIFDEATSALDARAERAIQGELDRLAVSRTTLVIAHRMSTIINASEILVLEQGRIVERGNHSQLLALRGIYAQMWSLQQQEQQLRQIEGEMVVRQVGERRRSVAA
jgi:ATP-binding cassette subfamily B protein